MKKDYLEILLNRQIADEGLITPHRQYKFHAGRRWTFDFAWPGVLGGNKFHSLAVEVDGGIWLKKGGHTTGKGFERDREKDAASVDHGWVVLRVTAKTIQSGAAIDLIKRILLRDTFLEVHEFGDCHQLTTDGVTTAAKNSTRGGAKRKGTRSAPRGSRKASRRPTPRRRPGPRVSRNPRRLPKEIEAYTKLSAKLGVGA